MSQSPKVITSYCTNGLIKILKKRLPFSVKVDEEITKAHPEWKEYFALNWDPFTDFPDDLIKDSKVILFFFNLSNKDSVDLLKKFQNHLKKKEEILKTVGSLYVIGQLANLLVRQHFHCCLQQTVHPLRYSSLMPVGLFW